MQDVRNPKFATCECTYGVQFLFCIQSEIFFFLLGFIENFFFRVFYYLFYFQSTELFSPSLSLFLSIWYLKSKKKKITVFPYVIHFIFPSKFYWFIHSTRIFISFFFIHFHTKEKIVNKISIDSLLKWNIFLHNKYHWEIRILIQLARIFFSFLSLYWFNDLMRVTTTTTTTTTTTKSVFFIRSTIINK